MKLIKGLSEDINASINIKNDNGTKIIITFNADPFHNGDDILNVIKGKEIYA
ncbi:MAG TPA: hypothetical protein VKI61_12865 [Chitinophagaceae bacterium]|nr:hypothetical protein [Chitinophagaceae bacterium]